MITPSALSFGPDVDHPRREEPRLGCNCRACYYARMDHVEETLRRLHEDEHRPRSAIDDPSRLLEYRLPILQQAMQSYLRGSVTYEAMKTNLIEQLWKMAQDTYKANCERAMRDPTSMLLPGRRYANGDLIPE